MSCSILISCSAEEWRHSPPSHQSRRVFHFHVQKAQLVAAESLGVRMIALGASRFGNIRFETKTTILAAMDNRQHVNKKPRPFGDRVPRNFGEDAVETLQIEDAAASNR